MTKETCINLVKNVVERTSLVSPYMKTLLEDELEKFQVCLCVYAHRGGAAESKELYKNIYYVVCTVSLDIAHNVRCYMLLIVIS